MTNLELVNAVTFSPDGTVVAAGLADRTVHIWDVRTGQPYGPVLRGHTNEVESVDFSLDGVTGQCGDDRTVRLWDTATGKPHGRPILAHEDLIWQVAFSPDSQTLAPLVAMARPKSGGSRTARRSGPNSQSMGPLYGLSFSPDGRTPTVGAGGAVRLWDLGLWSAAVGCRSVGRNLSLAEWQQFLPGRPYQRTCAEFPSGPGAPSSAPAAPYSS